MLIWYTPGKAGAAPAYRTSACTPATSTWTGTLVTSALVAVSYSATDAARAPSPEAYSTTVSPGAAGESGVINDPSAWDRRMMPRQSPVAAKNPGEAGAARTRISLLSAPPTVAFSRILPEPAVVQGITKVIASGETRISPTNCPFAVNEVDPRLVGSGVPVAACVLLASPTPRTVTNVPGANGN